MPYQVDQNLDDLLTVISSFSEIDNTQEFVSLICDNFSDLHATISDSAQEISDPSNMKMIEISVFIWYYITVKASGIATDSKDKKNHWFLKPNN
jgi:hypothetical protein